ncbi:hypothetical protein CBS147343_8136 [Aspergillus niger]|nr:hypothetical protein CBS133816_4229 [Aspergillus niger]KAI2912860.1 hypothetical protein CBS147371_7220 [Aspergillus niger]KAI2934086.1 hypothetical protein CBS147320_1324 [Aspergillus niger]KAI2991939.1 hypothetical protein CBS147344_1327 [Aspergillus niger]KAI3006463.1 hypothetical protein CBS147346_3754 [Aspergillus niger]
MFPSFRSHQKKNHTTPVLLKTYHIRSLYPLMEQHQKPMANISIGAEHQRVEFPTKANGLPTGFPPVLARRGVPEFMPVSEAVLPYHDLSDQ